LFQHDSYDNIGYVIEAYLYKVCSGDNNRIWMLTSYLSLIGSTKIEGAFKQKRREAFKKIIRIDGTNLRSGKRTNVFMRSSCLIEQ